MHATSPSSASRAFVACVASGVAFAVACGGRVASGGHETQSTPDAASVAPGGETSDAAVPPLDSGETTPAMDASDEAPFVRDSATPDDATVPADAEPDAPSDAVAISDAADGAAPGPDGVAPDAAPLPCIGDGCPVTLADGLHYTWGIAVNASSVFVAYTGTDAGGGVAAIPLEGGTPLLLSPGHTGAAYDVAVDDANVYWSNFEGAGAIDGVMKVPSAGGAAVSLAPLGFSPRELALAGTDVYWTDGTIDTLGNIVRAPSAGGTMPAAVVDGGHPWGIVVSGGTLYWSDVGTPHNADGAVMKLPLDGGSPVTLASGQIGPDIAVDGTRVYWTTADGRIRSTPLDGGAPVDIASGQMAPQAIAVDAANVYWVNTGVSVNRAPLDGGPPVMLASEPYAWDLAIDETSIYWTAGDRVRKLAK